MNEECGRGGSTAWALVDCVENASASNDDRRHFGDITEIALVQERLFKEGKFGRNQWLAKQ